ncbi:HPP family protein [Polynucleobacter sp. QLW-P1DATA-2]|uniref:HPP family protein n=1 Tax=unclassified Polynucleobacter TaxID=2640945 RepID=UPI0008F8552A|nr:MULTISPECIES: HPP family protein [unclassified Polynucleobacter]OIN00890.1 HPP family protein [Polynucleobacter sp. QLW-P1DATA-2]OIN02457.1 HPP family protein [Polynucleobacter sp. MWH-Tro8-2-5-gr]
MRHTAKYLIKHYSFYFGGDQPEVSWAERLRSCAGAFVGLILVFTIAKLLGELTGIDEWLMASLGASALLVFALPGSPMAQPWAVIAGNTLSAFIGISAAILIREPLLAMPIAASLSILGMFVLRCLHPPAAAVALIAILGHVTHYRYAFFPVMIDSILLVLAGAVYSNLTGKRYPNRPQ